jgi:hypothetical protein
MKNLKRRDGCGNCKWMWDLSEQDGDTTYHCTEGCDENIRRRYGRLFINWLWDHQLDLLTSPICDAWEKKPDEKS